MYSGTIMMIFLWFVWFLLLVVNHSYAAPTLQQPLQLEHQESILLQPSAATSKARALTGKFLHITDLHPDPFYKYHSSTAKDNACHRGRGSAGLLGAETTDCDSPITLINETFRWIEENLRDEIDFVVWTGDSARHDNDEEIPRTQEQVLTLNDFVVNRFVEVFGKDDNINDTDPTNDLIIPIVPTYGNNDILPHNIFTSGPNKWTKNYLQVWKRFIPEEQRHGFERWGWFSVEVILNRLTIFSLNTLYFFNSNAAVDGCAQKSEPGYEQMEWLRIQLQFIRERGMKAILMGHVPPARTSSKASWDETCWQKYTLWMEQYRDLIVGSLYGHMNIDHFMLQDFDDDRLVSGTAKSDMFPLPQLDDEFSTESASDYLEELRARWSKLPDPPKRKGTAVADTDDAYSEHPQSSQLSATKAKKGKKGHDDKAYQKFLDKIGGPWGERFSLSLVSPSVVPNYYPTLRVIQYNITGLDSSTPLSFTTPTRISNMDDSPTTATLTGNQYVDNRKRRKPKYPKFRIPQGPSKSSPPGPAYSPQTFTWLGYTQYYANLTTINRDFTADEEELVGGDIESSRWKGGKHSGKKPKDKNTRTPPKNFEYQEEYDTRTDKIYKLKDLTVRSYFDLASRIGQKKPKKSDQFLLDLDQQNFVDIKPNDIAGSVNASEADHSASNSNLDTNHLNKIKIETDKKKKKHKKHKKRKALNRVWLSFVRRAFVGSRDDDDLHDTFGQPIE